MKVRSLIKDKTINEWFDVINAPESTRRSYMQGIKEYTILCNKTPSDLLKEAKTEVGKGIPRSETKLRGYLLKYQNSLQNRGLADITIHRRLAGVQSFYKSFTIDLPLLPKVGRGGKIRPK